MKTFKEYNIMNDLNHVELMKHHKQKAVEAIKKGDHDAASYHSKEFSRHEEWLHNETANP